MRWTIPSARWTVPNVRGPFPKFGVLVPLRTSGNPRSFWYSWKIPEFGEIQKCQNSTNSAHVCIQTALRCNTLSVKQDEHLQLHLQFLFNLHEQNESKFYLIKKKTTRHFFPSKEHKKFRTPEKRVK